MAVSRGNTAVAQTLLEFGAMASLHDTDGCVLSAPEYCKLTAAALTKFNLRASL